MINTTPEGILARYRWRNRLLLVCAPSPDAAAYRAQQADLDVHQPELRERDLLVVPLFEAGPGEDVGAVIPADDVDRLRTQYRIAPGAFTVLLIGKDGAEKLRRDRPLPVAELIRAIDAMPMRREEMRRRE